MPMSNNGLTKLMEECGEAIQVSAKMIAYPNTDEHPDGKGSLKKRLMEELADVQAAIIFVCQKFDLDGEDLEFAKRVSQKVMTFQQWDTEQPARETQA